MISTHRCMKHRTEELLLGDSSSWFFLYKNITLKQGESLEEEYILGEKSGSSHKLEALDMAEQIHPHTYLYTAL